MTVFVPYCKISHSRLRVGNSAEVSEDDSKADNAEQFTKLIRDYAGIKKLDSALLNTLIDKITIGEPKKSGGETTQEVKICYKFIGNIS